MNTFLIVLFVVFCLIDLVAILSSKEHRETIMGFALIFLLVSSINIAFPSKPVDVIQDEIFDECDIVEVDASPYCDCIQLSNYVEKAHDEEARNGLIYLNAAAGIIAVPSVIGFVISVKEEKHHDKT